MLSLLCARTKPVVVSSLALFVAYSLHGQSGYAPQAGQYSIGGAMSGDQVRSRVAVAPAGGFMVWQDNATDGDGWGISAQRLNNNFSGSLSTFRVNSIAAGNQENPSVALLNDGGAVFVWQGGFSGRQHIYARFMNAAGSFLGADVMVNTFMGDQTVRVADQIAPVVTRLAGGNVAIIWSSFNQDGDKQGVYGRIFSPAGQPVSAEFRVNEATALNQRTPAIAAQGDGFVVTWISESSRGFDPQVSSGELFGFDVYARVFTATGAASGSEFKVNSAGRVCANPSVAGLSDGSIAFAWGERSAENRNVNAIVAANSWDIYSRKFNNSTAVNAAQRVNTTVYGDQYAPQISAVGSDQLIVWTSLAQDGSQEGVYGQLLYPGGELSGGEFKVNTTTIGQQMYPAVASDGATRFLVAWSSYVSNTRFDLFAQRYASSQPLPQLPAPYVSALSQSKLVFSWAELAGYNVVSYGIYLDGSSTPINVTSNSYAVTGLAPGSLHTAKIDFLLADGRRGVPSPVTSGATWGEDLNFDGLPDDWQATYWGNNQNNWPAGNVDSDSDGVSNVKEFLAGTIPTDSESVLRIKLEATPQGWRLSWNTEPGLFYQVQVSDNFRNWSNLGAPRFAATRSDSMLVTPSTGAAYYQVLRVR